MVNLKSYLLEATVDETRLSELLGQLRKYVQLGDRGFVAKFMAALRELLQEKGVSARQKYICLQVVNVAMQGRSELVAEVVEEKLLERLFLLAMFEAKSGSVETRGRKLLKQFDENAEEEASLDFYTLLLECFAVWGKDSPSPAFAAKHATLSKAFTLPDSQRHLHKYAEAEAPQKEQVEPVREGDVLQRVENGLQLLEKLAKGEGRECESSARRALKELEQVWKSLREDSARRTPSAARARNLLDRLNGKENGVLPALQSFFGTPRINPFRVSAEKDSPAPRQQASPEDIRALTGYVERERAGFQRKVGSLEEENRKLFDEKRKVELKLMGVEAELVSKENTIATLEEEVRRLQELSSNYLKEGLEFFRRNVAGARAPESLPSFNDVSRYSAISQRRFAEERPRTPLLEEPQRKSYIGDDLSTRSTRPRGLYENLELGRDPSTATNSDHSRGLGDVSLVKEKFKHTGDFMTNFNADIASILNRKSALPDAQTEFNASRRKNENSFGLSQTLGANHTRGRAQSSRLQDYVKKYTESDGSLFEPEFRRQEETVDYRPKFEAARQVVPGGILKYKNY